jgi:hypothetical protein
MPARAAIVVNDGQATPVAHTFTPTSDREADVFEDKASGIALGFPQILFRTRRPAAARNGQSSDANNRVYRIQVNVAWPVLEVTSPSTGTGIQPAPTIAYTLRANMEWILPERSTLSDRKDLRAIVYNMLDNSDVKKVLQDLESFY